MALKAKVSADKFLSDIGLTNEQALLILTFEVEFDGEEFTTVPYRPITDDLLWDYENEQIVKHSWLTEEGSLVARHNKSVFTLSPKYLVDDTDKRRLADEIGFDYDELIAERDSKRTADELGIDYDESTSERVGVTAKDFGISPQSLSFTESKYAKVNEIQTEVPSEDVVNHPNHYNSGKFETIEMIEEITKGYDDGFVAHCVGTATKYVSRAPFKHDTPIEDLRKAAKYLEFAIEYLTDDKDIEL